ncbi:hypothetical protein HGRIS_001467 [Hohenbuehelia grisea]|uniref:ARF7 effector protein C-terminal domain-containing protein n=1 Tax=Hohenbuehelia grisea TaxID=104357 RepID=A0ABR3JRJ8_9AGAR
MSQRALKKRRKSYGDFVQVYRQPGNPSIDDEEQEHLSPRRHIQVEASAAHSDRLSTTTGYFLTPSSPPRSPTGEWDQLNSTPSLFPQIDGTPEGFEENADDPEYDFWLSSMDIDPTAPKRKRPPSDRPMKQWQTYERDLYLNELLRLEGRGDYIHDVFCACSPTSGLPTYRCRDCDGGGLSCKDCIVSSHSINPFHRIENWDVEAQFFRRVTLKSLGLRVQLGHRIGT